MKLNRLVAALCLLFIVIAVVPASASLTQVVARGPVFIGERNVDISSGTNGHTVIAWWPDGVDRSSTAPSKTVNIGGNATSFTFDPAVFTGYTGTWYTHDTKPDIPVFVLYQPEISLTILDADTNKDITGQTVPLSSNITFRVDTNLYMALNYSVRPNYNPSDSFFTVKLLSPTGASIPQIYTGNIGAKTTKILKIDSNPMIKSPSYTWSDGPLWYKNAKGTDGSNVYPAGTYTFVVTQDLNDMTDSYTGNAAVGTVTSGNRQITFVADAFTSSPTALPSLTAPTDTTVTTPAPAEATPRPVSTIVTTKTTFTPLPAGIVILALGLGAGVFLVRRKY